MAEITVHSFTIYDPRTDHIEDAKGKATKEKIKEWHGEVVPNTEQIIDHSQLNANGRYHD